MSVLPINEEKNQRGQGLCQRSSSLGETSLRAQPIHPDAQFQVKLGALRSCLIQQIKTPRARLNLISNNRCRCTLR